MNVNVNAMNEPEHAVGTLILLPRVSSPPSFTARQYATAPRGGRNAWWLADCRYQDVREVVRLAVLDAQRRRGGRVWRLPRRPTLPLPAGCRGHAEDERREGFSLDKLAALRAIPLQLDGPNEIGAANNAPINEAFAKLEPLTPVAHDAVLALLHPCTGVPDSPSAEAAEPTA